jgi:Protein of unknown function (DUF4038)
MSSRRDFIKNTGAMVTAPFVVNGLRFEEQYNRGASAPMTAGKTAAPDPLGMSRNRRYVVNADHVPLLLQGDAAWSLIVSLDKAQASLYLKNRRQKGFNAILVNLMSISSASILL